MQLIEAAGGCEGIRDERLLDSALKSPFQSFGGEELYKKKVPKKIYDALLKVDVKPYVED